jgi:hypothetical protein
MVSAFGINDVTRELDNVADSASNTWEDVKQGAQQLGEQLGEAFASIGEAIDWLGDEIKKIRLGTPNLNQDFWGSLKTRANFDIRIESDIPNVFEVLDDLDNGLEVGGTLGHLGNKVKSDISMEIVRDEWLPHWGDEVGKVWDRWTTFPRTCKGRNYEGADYWECKQEDVDKDIESYRKGIKYQIRTIKNNLRKHNREITQQLEAIK